MHKLVILVESIDEPAFEENWPGFLHLVERMPGLRREATCRVDQVVYGHLNCALIHELYFDSLDALQHSMTSPVGQEAGRLLQEMTRGRVTLLFADHKEDTVENIRKYRRLDGDEERDADTG